MQKRNRKYTDQAAALLKLQRYCAYQERCHQEVRNKLLGLGVYGDTLEQVIITLIEDGFLNEERYARSFARGKFRMKSWGRRRIIMELKLKKLSEYCIKKAMEEIPEATYFEHLKAFLERKNAFLKEADIHKRRNKLAQYALRRGWEAPLVWRAVRELEKDN